MRQWSHAPLFLKITTRNNKILLLQSCHRAIKINDPYQAKSVLFPLLDIKPNSIIVSSQV